MSVFATLRRKRDRTKGAASNGTILVAEAKSEPIFNSTPNLHKINLGKTSRLPSPLLHQKSKQTTVFYPEEYEDVILEDEIDERQAGFGSRRSSSAAETGSYDKELGSSKFSSGGSKSGSRSLRHFASMISMFGSLKRTKSSRKMAYGSTQDLDSDKRNMTDFMRERTSAGKRPVDASTLTKDQTISSTDCLCSNVDDTKDRKHILTNTEPGVRSSSSSDDDDSRRSSLADFRKSGAVEKNQSEGTDPEYCTTKTEEELKRTKIMIQGIKKFNMDPKKGIEFLVEQTILQNTSDDVAKFLKFGEGLSKTAIGKYLGEHVDFNEEVLQAFLDLHNFKDLILVQALREFLWSFRLPGESQKIDRMMEAFAKRYCQSNPGIFSCTDTCYLLSYSIIMLNTTLHNPSVRDKPTVEQFIQMNRDVDCGKSLDKVVLMRLYNSILAEPFKIPPEDANDLVLTFFNPNIEGWLWKQGGYKTWKRRWFILSNNCLYYFKFTTDKSPRGIIPLENVNAKEVSSSKSNDLFPFILFKKSTTSMPSDVIKTCKTLSNGSTVLTQHHTITVASINHEDRKKWVQSINQNNSNSDFYDVLTIKKRLFEAKRQQNAKYKRTDAFRSETPKREIRKSSISQPSTAPDFEYKDKLPPELIVPAGPHKDPNNYFKSQNMFSSTASISSGGSVLERDSSYGSFSDISRSRSESRILDYSHDGSISSIEHDTGSLGSRVTLRQDERMNRGLMAPDRKLPQGDSESFGQDSRYDMHKKLSIIEESNNLSDRIGATRGNKICVDDFKNHRTPIDTKNKQVFGDSTSSGDDNFDYLKSAVSSDSANCDITCQIPHLRQRGALNSTSDTTKSIQGDTTEELSTRVQNPDDLTTDMVDRTILRVSRSGSLESDV